MLIDVDMRIDKGEFVSIVGPNGGGKTTLIKIIMGLISPSKGYITVLGLPPKKARDKVGYMPQKLDYDIKFPMSVFNLVLMGRLKKSFAFRYSNKDRDKVSNILDEFGMFKYKDRFFANLSGGEKRIVLIARALACEPDILIFDEPTTGIDANAESKFSEILNILKSRHKGMSILLVSHDLRFVNDIVDKVVCINKNAVMHSTCGLNDENAQSVYIKHLRMIEHNVSCKQ